MRFVIDYSNQKGGKNKKSKTFANIGNIILIISVPKYVALFLRFLQLIFNHIICIFLMLSDKSRTFPVRRSDVIDYLLNDNNPFNVLGNENLDPILKEDGISKKISQAGEKIGS